MRLVPPKLNDSATGSEKKVFSLLREIDFGDGAVALSSLNLAEHEYKRWAEVDFVLVMEGGLIVVEVKGGKVSCVNGLWRFEDRWGRVIEKGESPMAQAQSGYSSLLHKYISRSLGESTVRKVPTGFCVVFPGSSRSEVSHLFDGPEMPGELVGTREDCFDPGQFKSFLLRVINYWGRRHQVQVGKWTLEETRRIVSSMRPSFDRVPPLSITLSLIREEQCELTEDQYKFLDYMENAPRVLCTGGAGCGKTFLAVEALRRDRDEDPLLVTGTRTLAQYLRASNVPEPERILSFEELVERASSLGSRFKTLIVDEGQQVTSFEAFAVFSHVLGREFSQSRWRWFADPNRQVGSSSCYAGKAQEALKKWATIHVELRRNCRNTKQIIQAVEFATGAGVGSAEVKGAGPPVKYSESSSEEGVTREAGRQVREWLADEVVRPCDVMLLSALPIDQSSIPRIAGESGRGFIPWRSGLDKDIRSKDLLGANTIDAFRGLEAPFVILCDLESDLTAFESNLYLGMTRANVGLFVACGKQGKALILEKGLGAIKDSKK